jgi:uncharacterized protein YchJ
MMNEYIKHLESDEMLLLEEVHKTMPQRFHVPPRVSEKIGRNEPCICGSGVKFKKCCA